MRKNEDKKPNKKIPNDVCSFHPVSTKDECSSRDWLCAVFKSLFGGTRICACRVERFDPQVLVDFVEEESVDWPAILASDWAKHLKLMLVTLDS